MSYRIQIDGLTEKSSKLLKEEIEKLFPLLDGKVIIHKKPEIRPLSDFIDEEIKEFRFKFRKKEDNTWIWVKKD